MDHPKATFIREREVDETLEKHSRPAPALVREVLAKAAEMKGLNLQDVAVLTGIDNPEQLQALYHTARTIKETIYGKRLVLFAPLYISNLCSNECAYCAFRVRNKDIARRALNQAGITAETETLLCQGHKRILLVAGEYYNEKGLSYILEAIGSIYKARHKNAGIRRVNVNIAPLKVEEFRHLKT
ncbi:MAG: [FeFe] hydrogenase H-cluster radical SAM maturase HydG, partial [Mangrovibacterium sp.]